MPEPVKVTDKNGKEWILHPLDLEDMAELGEQLGAVEGWWEGGGATRSFLTVLWAAIRKTGLSYDDIVTKQWAVRREDVGHIFEASQGKALVNAVTEFILASTGGEPLGISEGVLPTLTTPGKG